MTPESVTLIGRDACLAELLRNIGQGVHTLLVGPKGIGKTRLLQEALLVLEGRRSRLGCPTAAGPAGKLLWVSLIAPLGDCLRQIGRKLAERGDLQVNGRKVESWDEARKMLSGNLRMQEAVLASFDAAQPRYVVLLDSLDRIAPAHQSLMEGLVGAAVVAAAASQINDSPHLQRVWRSFVRITMEPLPREEGILLVKHYLRRFRVSPRDPVLFAQEVWQASLGNPFLARTLVLRAARQGGTEDARAFRREGAGRYFNMGPVYMFLASGLTLYKIFSRGLDNRESYIVFSSLGVVAYMAFRVFRSFFIFRPQRGRDE
jgi:hypothetical protein